MKGRKGRDEAAAARQDGGATGDPLMTAFHALHQDGLLILPNAWDGGSVALVASLGAKAVVPTSAGVAWALGWPHGKALPVEWRGPRAGAKQT